MVSRTIFTVCWVSLVGADAVVIEVPDHRQIQHALFGVDVGDVRYPLAVGFIRIKLPVQQILVLVDLLPQLPPFSLFALEQLLPPAYPKNRSIQQLLVVFSLLPALP